jgi:hypothetical protein
MNHNSMQAFLFGISRLEQLNCKILSMPDSRFRHTDRIQNPGQFFRFHDFFFENDFPHWPASAAFLI